MASQEKLRAPGVYSEECVLHGIVVQMFPLFCCSRLWPCGVFEVVLRSRCPASAMVEVESRMLEVGGRNAEVLDVGGRLLEVGVESRMLEVGGRNAELLNVGGLEVEV